MATQEFEYIADSQWAGFWGGYGAERLLSNEINKRAQDGWRLTAVQAQKFWWFGIPWILQRRAKLVYIFEREKTG